MATTRSRFGGHDPADRAAMAAAYSASGVAWQAGPVVLYDRLADVVVDQSPVPLAGRLVLDLGAGTGAATRALTAAGAQAVAADAALGMLAAWPDRRTPAAVADALTLPFPAGAFDAVVAAFSLNHLTDPAAGLREAARVTRLGGAVIASAYAADDTHPVKAAVETAATTLGWSPAPWYATLRTAAAPALADAERMAAAASAAGLDGARVEHHIVDFGTVSPDVLIGWRTGMAQLAPFVAGLSPADATALDTHARSLLGPTPPPLRRSIMILTALL